MNSEHTVRIFEKKDEKPLKILMKETFGFPEDYWAWKHLYNPSFTPSSIIVAEKDEEIIGSSSWIPRELKISSSLTTKSALGGDTAVKSDYRGKKVGSNIIKFFNEQLEKNEIVILYGFASPEIARKFYAPLGFILMRDSTKEYVKFLNCNKFKEKISSKNKHEELKGKIRDVNLVIKLVLKGAPSFLIRTRDGNISLETINEATSEKPDVTIQGELSFLSPFFQGEKNMLDLVKLVLTRKLKTKGVMRNFRSLFCVFKIITPILKET